MTLSCSTTVCPDLPLEEALDFARDAGFGHIELFLSWTKSSPRLGGLEPSGVLASLDRADVAVSGLNIRNVTSVPLPAADKSPSPGIVPLLEDIALARALGLSTVNTKGGARDRQSLGDLVAGVVALLEQAPDTTVNLGNHHGNRLETLADYASVMPQLPDRAKVLLDSGHLLTAGVDVLRFAEGLVQRIGLVHLRDQKGDKPVPFGQGDLPFEALLGLLHGSGYTGTLVVELEHVSWADPLTATRAARQYVEDTLDHLGT